MSTEPLSHTLSTSPSWGVVEKYNKMVDLAQLNADPANWKWEGKQQWKVASENWRKLKEKWYGAMDNQQPSSDGPKSLSLEPLALSFLPFRNSSSSILVRESYVTMFQLVWAQAMSSEGEHGVLITGQPGTGKTTFLYYLLVQLLLRKQIVLFSIDGDELFLFHHDNVYRSNIMKLKDLESSLCFPQPKASNSILFIWSLFDIKERNEPSNLLVLRPCLPVQTASLDPSRYKIWVKYREPLLTGLTLWTRDELAQGLKYQEKYPSLLKALCKAYPPSKDQIDILDDEFPDIHALLKDGAASDVSSPDDALGYLLQTAIERFGYSARDVFRSVFKRDEITGEHQSACKIHYEGLLTAILALTGHEISDTAVQVSNRLVCLSPEHKRPLSNAKWSVNFKSKWVAKSVLQQLEKGADLEVRRYFGLLRRVPEAKSLAGTFLEPIAHRTIAETSSPGGWTLIKMTPNRSPHLLEPQPTFRIGDPSLDVQLAKIERETIELESTADLSTTLANDRYYIPKDPGFPLFDSFTIDLDYSHKFAVLWVFQVTTSQSHGGSAQGYREIRSIVGTLKERLGRTGTPKPSVVVRYILVVPTGNNQDLQWRFPSGWNKDFNRDDHRGDVYCLEIPISTVPT